METFLVMLAAFGIAVLSGMGVGSGGLLVVFLTLVADVPQIRAQGMNLLFFLFASGAAMLVHVQKRRLSLPVILLLSAAGLIGSLPGTYAALVLPEALVRRLFGGMLVLSGTVSLLRRGKPAEKTAKKL
ncbi:MAG: sulfite exporter TauE/SafE family protein [Clostridia bacterium]|nr:sulfite exporter TauE/SafE family protein [Clostridia bacterium]